MKPRQSVTTRVTIWGGIAGLTIGACIMIYAAAVAPTPQGPASILSATGICGLIGAVVGFVLASTRGEQ